MQSSPTALHCKYTKNYGNNKFDSIVFELATIFDAYIFKVFLNKAV